MNLNLSLDSLRSVNSLRGRNFNSNRRGGRRGMHNHNLRNDMKISLDPALIDPTKVYVSNINKNVSKEQLAEHLSKFTEVHNVHIVNKRTGGCNFGFVELRTVEDTQKLLKLEVQHRWLCGSLMNLSAAKRQFPHPGQANYKRPPLPERDFDIEPADASKPSIHLLVEDVLLKIFHSLPLKELIRTERVCRRWQNLVHCVVEKRASSEIKNGDIFLWLEENEIPLLIPSFSKILILCGQSITELKVTHSNLWRDGFLLRIIGNLCPFLESLCLEWHVCKLNPLYLQEITSSCPHVKRFRCRNPLLLNERCLETILVSWPHLEELHIVSNPNSQSFAHLPHSLKKLSIGSNGSRDNDEHIKFISDRCSNLEAVTLNFECLRNADVAQLGSGCPNLKEVKFSTSTSHEELIDFSCFRNLKNLFLIGGKMDLILVINSLPFLEELDLNCVDMVVSPVNSVFSSTPPLRSLCLIDCITPHEKAILNLVTNCPKLQVLKLECIFEDKNSILRIIKDCGALCELHCPSSFTITESDIGAFVDANKRRAGRLKLRIGLDYLALNSIERLSEAKYEIEIVDVGNLFSDFDVYPPEDFEDYDYDSYGSDDSYDDFFGNMVLHSVEDLLLGYWDE